MEAITVEQGTQEWFDLRMGRFTASQIHRLMSDPKLKADREKGLLSEGAKTYVAECTAEVLTGERQGQFSSDTTEWGNLNEPKAALYYNLMTGNDSNPTGFFEITEESGASPDLIVTEDGIEGLAEIKCPDNPAHHIKYFMMPELIEFRDTENRFELKDCTTFIKLAKPYYWQIQCNLLATGYDWCDFVSFRPDMPEASQMIIVRIYRDEVHLNKMKEKIEKATEYKNMLLDKFIFNA